MWFFAVLKTRSDSFPFLGLAYAELKVNFVEGFAVLCLRRFSLTLFEWLKPFLGLWFKMV